MQSIKEVHRYQWLQIIKISCILIIKAIFFAVYDVNLIFWKCKNLIQNGFPENLNCAT